MRGRSTDGGFALPLVLWLIALMVVAVAMLAMAASNRHLQSSTLGDRVEAEAAARAGINYAVARMDASLGEQRWRADGQPRHWNYNGYELTIIVRDEWGKFDLNAGDPDVLRALMQLQDIPPDQISAVINGVGAMRAARLSRQEGAGSNDMPTRLFNVASLSQLPGVAPETLARLSPELTIYTGRPLPDMALADARMRSALVAAGKAAGTPVGNNANGSGLYDIDVVATRPDRPPGRVQVVLQWTPRYDGGIEIRWLAWEHGRWQQ